MKQTLFSAAVLVTLFMASCNKTATVPEQTPTPESNMLFRTRVSAELVALPTSTLSTEIKTYLDQNVAGYTLIRVEKKFEPSTKTFWGTKVTVLQNGVPVDYFFDTSGAPTSRPAGPRGETITRLTAAQLPASVASYLSQTYAGYQLIAAESMQVSGAVQEYRVQIIANSQRMDVHFDGSGSFRDAHTAPGNLALTHSLSYIAQNDLPSTLQAVLSSTYSTYTYGWAEEHVHDGTTTYDVKLFNNGSPVVLHFDTTGTQVAPIGPGGIGSKPSGSAAPKASTNHLFILDASQLPSAITAYLQGNFSGHVFLAADRHTPPKATSAEYKIDIVVGTQLYKLRFSESGELLMAEARG